MKVFPNVIIPLTKEKKCLSVAILIPMLGNRKIPDTIKLIVVYRSIQIESIGEEVLDHFISEVKNQSVLFGDEVDKNLSIVYTPLNGAGLEPVTRVLKGSGFENITVVEEQRNPDGKFPTCPYPNSEMK